VTTAAAPTPAFTRIVLVTTVLVTAVALELFLASRRQPMVSERCAPFLWLFSGLFLLRVAGQVVVRLRGPRWLPPTEQWNLTPYRLLLPTQVGILGLLAWIDLDFARGHGVWVERRAGLGVGTMAFALLYASAMGVRYMVRMVRRPDQRWFGGAIPIVFHWVLAGYLFVFASYHASR
jgi:uncharacterized protein